jgi:hypothetical protein
LRMRSTGCTKCDLRPNSSVFSLSCSTWIVMLCHGIFEHGGDDNNKASSDPM